MVPDDVADDEHVPLLAGPARTPVQRSNTNTNSSISNSNRYSYGLTDVPAEQHRSYARSLRDWWNSGLVDLHDDDDIVDIDDDDTNEESGGRRLDEENSSDDHNSAGDENHGAARRGLGVRSNSRSGSSTRSARRVTVSQMVLESQRLLADINPLMSLGQNTAYREESGASFGAGHHERTFKTMSSDTASINQPEGLWAGSDPVQHAGETQQLSGKKTAWRHCCCNWQTILRLLILAIIVSALVLLFTFVDVNAEVQRFLEWMAGIGVWGGVAFVGAYVVGVVFLIPGVLLTLAAGFIWGIWVGSFLVWLGASLGANVSFALGRLVFSHWGTWASANFAKVALIERVVAKNGWKFILLLRISPIVPYAIMNYLLSLARIRHVHYAVATSVGMIPGVFLFVYIGTLARSFSDIASNDKSMETGREAVLIGGGIVTLLAVFLITFLASREIKRELAATTASMAVSIAYSKADRSRMSQREKV